MKLNVPDSRRRTIQVTVLILVIACLACVFVFRNYLNTLRPIFPDPVPAPSSLPDTDLVFGGVAELGFVNADGSAPIRIPFIILRKTSASSWGRPFVTGDNQTIVMTDGPYPAAGHIYIARVGENAVDCGWYGIPRLAADGRHLWVETDKGQEQYRPEDCGTENSPQKVYDGIPGALSPDEQYSAIIQSVNEGDDHYSVVVIRQIGTAMEKMVGEGDYPAWSRDGQWLAYTGKDGIYIVRNNADTEPRRLVSLASPDPGSGVSVYGGYPPIHYVPPHPSWSPDGEWLVYHAYHRDLPDVNYSIFKVNVNTGETIKLLDDGYSPYWRWPIEEP